METVFDTRATDDVLDLWMDGFNPVREGWVKLGPADADNALVWAWDCRERGIEVGVFISPRGKLSFYAMASRAEVFSQGTTRTAGARPPVERGAGAPA